MSWKFFDSNGNLLTKQSTGSPSGAAGGDLSGTYPNPSVVDDSHGHTATTVTTHSTAHAHSDLTGVTSDQHHAKVHTHADAGEGGTVDHGALTGLADNDHPQYALDSNLTAHTGDTSDAHDASAISILDTAGDFTATDVEGALAELQSDNEAHAASASAHHDPVTIGADAEHTLAGQALSGVDADTNVRGHMRFTNITPLAVEPDVIAAAGTATDPARLDHQHGIDTYSSSPAKTTPGVTGTAGTSGTDPARGNHTHESPGGVMSLTATQTATAATTRLVGASFTLPANKATVGMVIRFRMWISVTKTTSPPTLTFALDLDGVNLATGTIAQTSSANTNAGWIEGAVTIRTIGAGGTCIAGFNVGYQGASAFSGAVGGVVNTSTSAIDTTADRLFELTAKMDTGVASNTLAIPQGVAWIEKM